jgi:serine/threonine-protein kinase
MDLRDQLQAELGSSYTLGVELGGGGMSRVFIAEDLTLGRTVVVKVLPPELADGVNAERFRREIQVAARLQQPFIVPLLSAGGSGRLLYFTMPKVDGETLHARLARDKQLPIGEVVRVLRDVLTALAYAHEHRVVHRDIKPANVFLSGQHAVVSDFGIARALGAAAGDGDSLTATGIAIGTPAYMAPEQASGGTGVDHRADLYAVGVMAYEMVAGVLPFTGPTAAHVIARQLREPPEPLTHHRPSVPPGLAQLVQRLLEKSPADRPQSADEVLRGLEDVPITPMQGLTAGAPVPPMPLGGRASPASRRSLLYVVVAILLVVGGYVGYTRLPGSRAARVGAGASSDAQTQTASSIAVMPFINKSSDRDNAYFADGLTDELIKTLGELQGLTVIGRSSVFALRDKGLDARQIGDTLGVTHILEASVQRAGAILRVTVHLVRTRDGAAIWSERYDGDVRDVFAVQDSIARTIANSLRPKLASADSAPRPARETSSEAYDLYLRGLELFNARTDLPRSVRYFTEALAKDPMFAEARGGLALAFLVIADESVAKGTSGREALNLFERAKVEAEGAIQRREATAEAHAALAMYYLIAQRDFATSEKHLLRAIQIRPGYATAHDWYALHLAFRGRLVEARRENALARQLDPLTTILVLHDWLIATLERQYDSAVTVSARLLLLGNHDDSVYVYEGLAHVHSLQGRHTEALADARRAIALKGADTVDRSIYATVLARAGRRTEARRIAADMQTPAAQKKIPGWNLAVLALVLGDTAEALERLERFFEGRYQLWYLQVGVAPEFEALHSKPRFNAWLRRLGLTPTRVRQSSLPADRMQAAAVANAELQPISSDVDFYDDLSPPLRLAARADGLQPALPLQRTDRRGLTVLADDERAKEARCARNGVTARSRSGRYTVLL